MIRFSRFGPTMVLSIVAALCFVLTSYASPGERGSCGIHEQLTREQRAEVHGRILELWHEGSTHQEIHDGVAELMKSYGIDMPDNYGRNHENRGGIPGFGHGPDHIMQDLTKRQRAQVRGQIIELWSEGAGIEEIHDTVVELLKGYGVEAPKHRGFGHGTHGRGHRPGLFMQDLTDEQRAEVFGQMQELRSRGAGPEEIHDVMSELLKDYGVEVPEHGGLGHGTHGRGHGPGLFMQDLTDEQRAEAFGQMQELRSRGAGPEEIHDAMSELLKGYGVEVPEQGVPGHSKHGFGHGSGRFMRDLTTEQRSEIRGRMLALWTGGSTHEEIRIAVDELLQSYGIDPADNEKAAVSGEESEGIAKDLRLSIEASPNPFDEQTNISYNLPTQTNVRVVVYDLDGQTIRFFDMGHQTAGSYRVAWDGADEIGNRVMNGPYLCRIHAGEFTATSRVMLIR